MISFWLIINEGLLSVTFFKAVQVIFWPFILVLVAFPDVNVSKTFGFSVMQFNFLAM